MKIQHKVIKVGIIYNAFDPSAIQRDEIVYRKNTKLKTYLHDLPTDCDWLIGLNGNPVDLTVDGDRRLRADDTIQLVVVPHGKGGVKNILRMAALVAVAVGASLLFAPGGALAFSAFGSAAAGAAIGMTAFSLAGSLLINAVLPPAKPKTDNDDSQSYGYDGAKNTAKQGVAMPVVYGMYRVAGNYVDLYTQNVGDDQYLYGRTVLSEGKISSVTLPLLNDQPIDTYQAVDWGASMGGNDEPVNPWFNRNLTQFNKNVKLTNAWTSYTTSAPVDQLQVNLAFPRGLVSINDKGKKKNRSAGIEIQYTEKGTANWRPFGTSQQIDNAGAIGGAATPATTKLAVTVQPTLSATDVPVPYSFDIEYRVAGTSTWSKFKTVTGTSNNLVYVTNNNNWAEVNDGSVTYSYQANSMSYEWAVPTGAYEMRITGQGTMTSWGYVVNQRVGDAIRRFTDNRAKPIRKTIESGKLDLGNYDVRMRFAGVMSTDENDIDEMYLSDIGEITTTTITMSNIANAYYRIKMTEQLNGVPNITWLVKGVECQQYDSNGNPTVKTWTDNPAWIILDMLVGADRGRPDLYSIDYPMFVEWAKYCDDANLKFNGTFDSTTTLWDAAVTVLKVGHANFSRIGTKLSLTIDRPQEPVMLFGPGNIFKDTFNISYLGMADRANEYEVSYFDRDSNNEQKTIRIIDPDADNRGDSPRPVSYSLVGVDNFEQAQKEAWYQLYNNRYIRRTIKFEAPIESIGLGIGDVALIQHDMMDWGTSGRLGSDNTTTVVNLDKMAEMEAGKNYSMLVIHDAVKLGTSDTNNTYSTGSNSVRANNLDKAITNSASMKRMVVGSADYQIVEARLSGFNVDLVLDRPYVAPASPTQVFFYDTDVVEERDVVFKAGTSAIITVTSAFSQVPAQYVNYMFGVKEIVKKPYRLKAMSGTGYDKRTLTFIEYNPAIYNAPETIVPFPPTTLPRGVQHVTNLKYAYDLRTTDVNTAVRGVVSWDTADSPNYGGVDIYVALNDADYVFSKSVLNATECQLDFHLNDTVGIKVVAFNTTQLRAPIGTAPTITQSIIAGPAYLDAPTNLVVNQVNYLALGLVEATWDAPLSSLDTGVKFRVQSLLSGATEWDEYGVTSETLLRLGDLPAGNHKVRVRTERAEAISVWLEKPFAVNTTAQTIEPGATIGAPIGTNIGGRPVQQFLDAIDAVEGGGFTDNTPPGIPTGLAALSAITDAGVDLSYSWTAVSDGDLAGYDIAIKQGAGGYIEFGTTGNNYKLTAQTRGTTYTAKVRAYDKAGNRSGWSGEVTHVTARDNVPPALPTGLVVDATFETAFVNFTAPSDSDLASVTVTLYLQSNNSVVDTKVLSVRPGAKANAIFINLNKNVGYYVKALATDTSGNSSALTSSVTFTTAGGVNLADFTPGLTGIVTVATLPSATGYTGGSTVFNQADGRLYNYVNGAWVKAVDTTIADNSITGVKLQDLTIAGGKLANDAITNAKLADNAVQSENLVDLSVVTGKIANAAIDGGKLANGAVSEIKLVDGAVTGNKIKDLAVTTVKLVDGAITETKITNDSVTTLKIKAGSVDADRIATNAVTTNKLNVQSRPNSTIGINIRIGANGIMYWDPGTINILQDDGSYVGRAVTSGAAAWDSTWVPPLYVYYDVNANNGRLDLAIGGSVLTNPKLIVIATWNGAANLTVWSGVGTSIHGDKIVTGSIDADRIIARTIDANKIKTGTLTGNEIAANTIAANKLTVQSRPISTIGANFRLENGVLKWDKHTLSKVNEAGAQVTYEISANQASFTAPAIYVIHFGERGYYDYNNDRSFYDSPDATKIAIWEGGTALSVQAGVGSLISGDRIVTGSIKAGNIAAGAISAEKMLIGDTTNYAENPDFGLGNVGWTLQSNSGVAPAIVQSSEAYQGGWLAAVTGAGTGGFRNKANMRVTSGDQLLGVMIAKGGNAAMYPRICWLNSAGNEVGVAQGGSIVANGAYQRVLLNSVVPAGVVFARIEVFYDVKASGFAYCGYTALMRRSTGELIVDGVITTDKIATNAITADKILANQISATKLSIGSRPINTIGLNLRVGANGAVYWDAGQIRVTNNDGILGNYSVPGNGPIGYQGATMYFFYTPGRPVIDYNTDEANMRSDGNIAIAVWKGGPDLTAMSGVGTSINGDQIVTGSINAGVIAAGAITTDKITVGTLNGDRIATNTLNADRIVSNSITAGKLSIQTKPISMSGVNMRWDVDNVVRWEAGTITYPDTNGTYITKPVIAGAMGWGGWNKPVTFCYNSSLASSSLSNVYYDIDLGAQTNMIPVAIWNSSSSDFVVKSGVSTLIAGDRIVTGTIVAGKIAAGTLTAREIKGESISGDKLVVGTITAAQIAAGAINASKLLVTSMTNLNPDPGFRDTKFWRNEGYVNGDLGTYAGSTGGWYNSHGPDINELVGTTQYAMLWDGYFKSGARQHIFSEAKPNIKGGSTYSLSAFCRNASNDTICVYIRYFNVSGGVLKDDALSWGPGEQSTKSIQVVAPSGVNSYQFIVFNLTTANQFSGNAQVANLQVVEAVGATTIMNGAITTDKITVNSLNGDRIQVGTLNADKISANGVLSNTITVSGTSGNIGDSVLNATRAAAGVDIIGNDNIISKGEKAELISRWQIMEQQWIYVRDTANSLGLGFGGLDSHKNALADYLTSLSPNWANPGVDTPVNGDTLRTLFMNFSYALADHQRNISSTAAGRAAWAGVTGANRPADNATVGAPVGTNVGNTPAQSVETAANNSTMAAWSPYGNQHGVLGNRITKLQPNGWYSNVYTQEYYYDGCVVAGTLAVPGSFMGLSSNRQVRNGEDYKLMDYAWHRSVNGDFYAYESGNQVQGFGNSNNGGLDSVILSIVYDGKTVRYYRNEQLLREVSTSAGRGFAGAVTIDAIGTYVSNLKFTSGNDNSLNRTDPAARVNANTTQIDPGKITISGATTLASWRYGGDTTKIEGGNIAANTITANKLTIGNRGLGFIGLNFEWNPVTNAVNWSDGYIYFMDNNGNQNQSYINAGSTNGALAHQFFYWTQGSTTIDFNQQFPVGDDKVMIATWWGSTNINVNYGGTIIHGDRITTGTINANKIVAGSITAGLIAGNSITADKLSVGSLSAISGTIGLLRTAASGARTEIESNQIRVYDGNNTMRVRMGIW
jgi:predicted phage tail protein